MATTIKPSNSVSIKIQRVLTAYFALREDTPEYEKNVKDTTQVYTVKSGDSLSKIAKKYKTTVAKIKKDNNLKSNTIHPKDKLNIITKAKKKKIGDKVRFKKITSANLGDEVYVVVETENMPDREIKMNFKQGGDKKVITDVKEPIYVTQEGNKQANFLFTAKVGEFSKKDTVINAKDFENHAICKIKLASSNDDTNKKYKDDLNKAEDKKSFFYILMDAEPEDNDWFSVQYEEVFDNRPNVWYYGEGNWFELKSNSILEYNIYSDGRIEKSNVEKMEEVIYNYYDRKGDKYVLGTTKLIEVDKWKKKNIKATPITKTFLIDARVLDKYSSAEIKYRIIKWSTSKERYYINPDCFAGLIGAMIEESIIDLGSTGFSDINGSPGNSSSHINGVAGDLRYLSTNKNGEPTYLQHSHFDYERQVKFNNALYKFGWGRKKKMLSENFKRIIGEKEVVNSKTNKKEKVKITETTLLPYTQHYKTKKVRHHHHLHIFGFDFSKIKKI